MAGTVVSTVTNLFDTAIGPVSVQTSVLQGYDIDDYVHDSAMSQAIMIQFVNAANSADTTLAANRIPVNIEGTAVGGY